MSDLEVRTAYRYSPDRIGLWLSWALIPIWGLYAPSVVILILIYLIMNPGYFSMPSTSNLLTMGVMLLLAAITGFFSTLFFSDNRIKLSREGIRLPGLIPVFSRFARDCRWQEIQLVQVFDTNAADFSGSKLVLSTGNQKTLALELSQFRPDDLERLILSIDLWADPSTKADSFASFVEKYDGKGKGSKTGFTQLWEEELQQRFSATSFCPLEPGADLQGGRLRILRQLAFGGLSAIYLCQFAERELFVLKELVVPSDTKAELKEKALELFQREAQLLCRLSHSNMVRVCDCFVEQGRHYMRMEYIRGLNLRQLVRERGAQSEGDTLRWANAICDVLVYLHSQSPPVVHRDLTPDNVILRDHKTPIVIDFGAANEFIGKSTGTLVGTQCYMAPEQFRGKASPASDIYSLGATMHFLLTAEDPEPLMSCNPQTLRCEISNETNELIHRCTALNQNDRLQSSASLQKEIQERLSKFA